MSEFISCDQYH